MNKRNRKLFPISIKTPLLYRGKAALRSSKTERISYGPLFACSDCGRAYKLKSSLRNHQKWECGKEPQFECLYCSYKAKQKMHMMRHMERLHKDVDYAAMSETVLDFNIEAASKIKV